MQSTVSFSPAVAIAFGMLILAFLAQLTTSIVTSVKVGRYFGKLDETQRQFGAALAEMKTGMKEHDDKDDERFGVLSEHITRVELKVAVTRQSPQVQS